ncbi:hypothetical protein NHX12_002913 [Muraenolepis orangiensis]|uniref:Uncharacterized protein n=1 Tax=Muraenolepis orangiensis TaxID=630683 RepID=A0A9Q0DZC0_9TELE|nr:hypothetical protein NHX12_002913 [Muraenolepis orangiensis]
MGFGSSREPQPSHGLRCITPMMYSCQEPEVKSSPHPSTTACREQSAAFPGGNAEDEKARTHTLPPVSPTHECRIRVLLREQAATH